MKSILNPNAYARHFQMLALALVVSVMLPALAFAQTTPADGIDHIFATVDISNLLGTVTGLLATGVTIVLAFKGFRVVKRVLAGI